LVFSGRSSYLGIFAAKEANFVVCVLDCFFDLKLEKAAGCVLICKYLQINARICKKMQEKGKDNLPLTFKSKV
jgi:hypothetical protein